MSTAKKTKSTSNRTRTAHAAAINSMVGELVELTIAAKKANTALYAHRDRLEGMLTLGYKCEQPVGHNGYTKVTISYDRVTRRTLSKKALMLAGVPVETIESCTLETTPMVLSVRLFTDKESGNNEWGGED